GSGAGGSRRRRGCCSGSRGRGARDARGAGPVSRAACRRVAGGHARRRAGTSADVSGAEVAAVPVRIDTGPAGGAIGLIFVAREDAAGRVLLRNGIVAASDDADTGDGDGGGEKDFDGVGSHV